MTFLAVVESIFTQVMYLSTTGKNSGLGLPPYGSHRALHALRGNTYALSQLDRTRIKKHRGSVTSLFAQMVLLVHVHCNSIDKIFVYVLVFICHCLCHLYATKTLMIQTHLIHLWQLQYTMPQVL